MVYEFERPVKLGDETIGMVVWSRNGLFRGTTTWIAMDRHFVIGHADSRAEAEMIVYKDTPFTPPKVIFRAS
jgi:hypothetical protein